MSKILKIKLTEHNFEHNLAKKKNYSEPKIFDAAGDINKRWYVYFSYRNTHTGYLERYPNNIYVSQTLTAVERYRELKQIQKNLSLMLKEGLNPFDVDASQELNEVLTIEKAFEFALNIKKQKQSETTYQNFESRIKRFQKWLTEKGFKGKPISVINKKVVNNYLNFVLESSSARNRNNTRLDLSSLFQVLDDNEIITSNIVAKTKIEKSTPERNKSYTSTEEEKLFEYMEKNDPLMLLFVQFVSYNFLRPVEVCRLRINDIDLKNKRLSIRAKNKPVKIKIIPQIMIDFLPDLSTYKNNELLFTPTGPGEWDAKENNRRNHFSKHFKTIKDKFGLGEDYGLYSFRHTFISRLYSELLKTSTPDATQSKLMLITGHSTRKALQQYLRDIDAILPEDYSEHLK